MNDEDREANAIFLSKDTDSLEKAIQKEIKKYLLENISIEQFYGELNTLVRTKLISHLNTNILSRYGRKMNYLSLNSTAISTEVKSFLEIEHQVKHQVQEEIIIINNNVQMTPNNIGKYRAYGSPNLDVWVRENLDIVIKSTLFEESYVDILSDFSSIRKTIKNQMVLLAESIGYTVKQIVSKPENETLELTKYFALNVKETFETKDSNVKVGLSIFVDLKIDDLKKIEPLLVSKVNIKSSMESLIDSEVRSFLHNVEPERFYMRYSNTDNAYPEEKLSVEKEIINIIRASLEKEPFYAQVKNIVPKPVETEVKRRFQELYRKFCKFRFEVTPFKGSDSVWFNGKMQVESVDKDSWYTFQSRNNTLEEIKNYLIEDLTENLKIYSNGSLEYMNKIDRDALSELLNRWGKECIRDQFGLIVSIKSVGRESTESEILETTYNKQIKQAKIGSP